MTQPRSPVDMGFDRNEEALRKAEEGKAWRKRDESATETNRQQLLHLRSRLRLTFLSVTLYHPSPSQTALSRQDPLRENTSYTNFARSCREKLICHTTQSGHAKLEMRQVESLSPPALSPKYESVDVQNIIITFERWNDLCCSGLVVLRCLCLTIIKTYDSRL